MEFRTTMNSAVTSVEEIECVLKGMWGPYGSSVLIQDASGLMFMTRRGWPVVQSVYGDRPQQDVFIKVLLESLRQVHNEFGDGVKSFILIASAFLKSLNHSSLQINQSRLHILQELKKLLNSLSVISVTPENSNFPLNDKEFFFKATSALFYTSCSLSVSFYLQKTFHDWLNLFVEAFNCKYTPKSNLLCFEYLLRNFSVLCCKNFNGSRSVSDSCVVPGFLVKGSAINFHKFEEEVVKIVVYLPNDDKDDIDLETEVKSLIINNCSEFTHRIMLLTSAVLPDLLLFTLRRRNFIVLPGIPRNDAEYISFVLQSESSSIVSIKSYVISSQEFTCLKLPHVWQLIIHAPTDSLMHEFTAVCKNAVKLLLMIERNQNYELVEAGGTFEKKLNFFISDKITRRSNIFYPVSSRTELLSWHREQQFAKVCKEKLHINCSEKSVSTTSMEIEQNHSNSKRGAQGPSINEPVDVISKSREVLVKKHLCNLNLNQMMSSFQNVDDMLLEAFTHSLLAIPRLMKHDAASTDVYEPVALKIGLVQHVLTVVLRIMKCDMCS